MRRNLSKPTLLARLVRLKRNEQGVTVLEFALVSPLLFTLLLGAFDVGYSLYARSVLHGAVQKAARDSGLLENASNQTDVDAAVTATIATLMAVDGDNSIVYVRRNYASFGDVGEMEDFTDSDGDNICDLGEPYEDSNGSDAWDEKGASGQGGARATVLYTVTFKYKRIFPVHKFVGGSAFTTLKASTVLRNQPYAEEEEVTISTKHCEAANL